MQTHNLNIISPLILVAVLASAAAAITTTAPSPEPLLGGYTPIDVSDPHVIEVAKFAIEQKNTHVVNKGHRLVFLEVVEGWSQVVTGINYRLVISAKGVNRPNGGSRLYTAEVYKRPWEHFMKLTSFTQPQSNE